MVQFVHPATKDITLAGVLSALADPIRLQIVRGLLQESGCLSCTAASPCPTIAKSTLSNHFRVLREAGLIQTSKKGVEHQNAVRAADIVSTGTLSREPLVRGAWLKPGTHLDLVGAFLPDMRESDDEAVRKATVFVDTREGALKEAGDIVQAIKSGALTESRIAADLFDLARGKHKGRKSDDEITLFKSVGTAIEDLAAARLLMERVD